MFTENVNFKLDEVFINKMAKQRKDEINDFTYWDKLPKTVREKMMNSHFLPSPYYTFVLWKNKGTDLTLQVIDMINQSREIVNTARLYREKEYGIPYDQHMGVKEIEEMYDNYLDEKKDRSINGVNKFR